MTDTGPIGAATDTAAFVRAQIANGVSVETLRKALRIRPEHMLDLLQGPPPEFVAKVDASPVWQGSTLPPVPKPEPKARIAKPPSSAGLSRAEVVRRAQENRAIAWRLMQRALPIVAEITGVDTARISGRDKSDLPVAVRGMIFSLMHVAASALPFSSLGWTLDKRSSSAVEGSMARCLRMRLVNKEFNGWYLSALSRLARP
jgi:hypothetical protein